ncbi:alpha/beta-hydrolase [Wolfiporia cocos MD-104 SS10]|uniref:Alpha/beta-hydrolase n=1 Tax=Wolfiporia cocos (strain MD-104) TaxID=742152 RepID=A0A2H3JKK0_WOLCO|nr:alpha/beta-hydrolase [Wolfiporia cocos MD-104 SS10]
MQALWLPTPVTIFFRRLMHALSSISIIRHNPQQRPETDDESRGEGLKLWDAFRFIRWPAWIDHERASAHASASGNASESSMKAGPSPTPHVEYSPQRHESTATTHSTDTIHQLLSNPTLYDPVRKPRYPITLCHGLYGFDVRGPSAFPRLQMHYWSNVLSIIRDKVGAEVLVTSVPSTGSIASRAESLDRFLKQKAVGRGINFVAHSMGGLDCRHLISHIKPKEYTPLSLTTIATPHRGSPFMDWCRENIGLGRLRNNEKTLDATEHAMDDDPESPSPTRPGSQAMSSDNTPTVTTKLWLASLSSSFTTRLISFLDFPAYANLTSTYLNTEFNPTTPNHPSVKYFSVAGRIENINIFHPLWLPKMVLDEFEEKERERLRTKGDSRHARKKEWGNDGLVTIQSARWGEFLGVLEGCDHWDIRGARGPDVELPSVSLPKIVRDVRKWKQDDYKEHDWPIPGMPARKTAAKSSGARISEQTHKKVRAHRERRPYASVGMNGEEKEHADEAVKSSTDKLSAVFDWLVEQVPSPSTVNPLSSSSSPERDKEYLKKAAADRGKKVAADKGKKVERHELATKEDLERFYVALCRKLYDEGL